MQTHHDPSATASLLFAMRTLSVRFCLSGIADTSTAYCFVPFRCPSLSLLGMVGCNFEVSKKQRLAGGFLTPAAWFHGYEHSVDLIQGFLVIEFHNPACIGDIVLVEHTE